MAEKKMHLEQRHMHSADYLDHYAAPSTSAKAEPIMPIRGNFLEKISEMEIT